MGLIANLQKPNVSWRLQTTKDLLLCISDHLSSKLECRGQIYRVAIGVYDNKQEQCRQWCNDNKQPDSSIFFEPPASVMIKHRGSVTKEYVIQHIVKQHFPEIWAGHGSGNQVSIIPKLVPGIYEYRPINNGKNRAWCMVMYPNSSN